MRFMVMVKSDESSEAGEPPGTEVLDAMTAFNMEMIKAGVMLAGEGLRSTSHGVRVKFESGEPTITDGPFAEAKEVVAGYWIIETRDRDEAIEWFKRCPAPVEIRPLYEPSDFEDLPSGSAPAEKEA